MRFMLLLKANEQSEAGAMPSEAELAAMGRYNEEMVKAGVLLAGEGLHASARGARVTFGRGRTKVVEGPFDGTRDLVAGFWIIQAKSWEEALEWVKRCPQGEHEFEIEVRQVVEAEDFGEEFTPELRTREERLRAEVAGKA
ncbi:Uncharacterized conserved protein [Amycolatopsis arida]|uniref:Uncharacterized conserved protein n=1 Tax=Amycolatopsis arida TaxID=587909 RepID=A0A1I5R0U2_9PSEU|nr:YciI family protein [Amycolatopsis arida]TDX99032.1 hypothetical protein CLV69_101833 [Amycolatopsis arida]SFP52109.1 Uncharacterized conserved protein [Amycolatopsis arida]